MNKQQLQLVSPVKASGHITEVSGPIIRAVISAVAVGDIVEVKRRNLKPLRAEVVGFSDSKTILTPFGDTTGIIPGETVTPINNGQEICLGDHLLGSVVDAFGNQIYPIEKKENDIRSYFSTINHPPPLPLARRSITRPFITGIRSIDAFLPLACGQRLGVFAEPGVGKSTLLTTIAASSQADVNVIGLIGERGREVNELVRETLDEETLSRSVVVVSTSDEPAILRASAALTATRIAEYFRDKGLNVLLQIDSLTRLCRALREVGLAAGEIPIRRGYPASVFAKLPALIERAGMGEKGSITALYTILLSSDLDEDPMVDELKSLTDGHLILSKKLAERGHFPAISVIDSISRLAPKVMRNGILQATSVFRKFLARLENDKDVVSFGGVPDKELKIALALEEHLYTFLRQGKCENSSSDETSEKIIELYNYALKISKNI